MKNFLRFLFVLIFSQMIFAQDTNFEGIQYSGNVPPDPVIAVGSNHIIQAVNRKLAIFNKTGTKLIEQSFNDFFAGQSPPESIFDPKVAYDQYSNRFILLAAAKNSSGSESFYLLAVTQSSDPTGNWFKYKLNCKDGGSLAAFYIDFPGLGYDQDALYLTSHQINDLGSYYPKVTIFNKTEVYSGTISYRKDFNDFSSGGTYPAKLKPMRKFGNSNNYYLVNTESPSQIRIWKIENPLQSTASLNVATTITLGSYSSIEEAVQKGTTNKVDMGDYGISDVVCKDGYVYGAYKVQNTTSDGSMIAYFKINTGNNFELLINGKIETPNKYYYYPVLHPDNDGNIVFVFNKSSSDDYIGVAWTILYAGTTDITSIQWLKEGTNGYYHLLNSENRWGDYSGIALDPSNGYHVWICGEWANTATEWSTWIGKIITKETLNFTFTNIIYDEGTGILNTNAGGSFAVNSSSVNSSASLPLVTGVSYNEKTNNERFSNWNSSSYTYKHNQWNNLSDRKFLSNNFDALFNTTDQKAFFKSINYSKININLDGQLITGKGAGQFQDPWYVLSDGSQPGNYWKQFNSFYEPTGKDGATEKGVFLNQDPNIPGTPYYSVQAPLTQDIYLSQTGKTHKFYFLNWSTSGASIQQVGTNPSGYDQKAVVFTSGSTSVNANYKGTHLSDNASAFTNTSQRKLVRTKDNWLHQVYESMGHVWLEHSTNNGSTWFLGNNGQPLDDGGGKCPSIDWHYNTDDPNNSEYYAFVVVYQQPSGSVYTIEYEVFNYSSGSYVRRGKSFPARLLYTEPTGGDQYSSTNANPNIAWGNYRFVLTFERKSTAGSMQPGIYWIYGALYEGGIEPAPAYPCDPVKITVSTSSSINATVSINKSGDDPSNFDIVYQSASSAPANIIDVMLSCRENEGSWVTSQGIVTTLSTSSGYLNTKPSVVQMPDNNIRIAWIRNMYNSLDQPSVVNTAYWNSASPSVYTYAGNGVNSVSLNIKDDNANTYYAYAQNTNNSSWQNFASNNSSTITLNTTGRDIQLSNGSTSSNMYASAYYTRLLQNSFYQEDKE